MKPTQFRRPFLSLKSLSNLSSSLLWFQLPNKAWEANLDVSLDLTKILRARLEAGKFCSESESEINSHSHAVWKPETVALN